MKVYVLEVGHYMDCAHSIAVFDSFEAAYKCLTKRGKWVELYKGITKIRRIFDRDTETRQQWASIIEVELNGKSRKGFVDNYE